MPAEPETLAVLVRRQAEARGAHPLLVCDDDRLSYAEAQRRSADLARGLVALGASKRFLLRKFQFCPAARSI